MKTHTEHLDGCRGALVVPHLITIPFNVSLSGSPSFIDSARDDLLIPQATSTRQRHF
jgi:hypothetical protein